LSETTERIVVAIEAVKYGATLISLLRGLQ
jgi:hypothetical protein